NFQNGHSSHNLVIEGITIPANVAISFNSGRVSLVMMRGSRLARQEIMVSGVPINASRIDLNPRNSDADIMIGGGGIFQEKLSH
ncbi:MAG: hypothetical protein FWC65_00160, partial [Treponema sp.]|nr:hypothetical protein [Treponema sp.]